MLDESLLTGESVSGRAKQARPAPSSRARPQPAVTTCLMSSPARWWCGAAALAEVTATGVRSEIGKIGQSLSALETETAATAGADHADSCDVFAHCRRRASARWRCCSTGSAAAAGSTRVLAGIALGMSMLPEEFPVVLTVFLAMGAWRISQARVLTRRAAAIESLGSATVLCTDKTGTLTENRMSVAESGAARRRRDTRLRRSAAAP